MLLSAPGAGRAVGVGWFAALVRLVRSAQPDAIAGAVLDCGAAPGAAMAAIRMGGIDTLVVRVRPLVRRKLAQIGAMRGISVMAAAPPALDLGPEGEPLAACRAYLANHGR